MKQLKDPEDNYFQEIIDEDGNQYSVPTEIFELIPDAVFIQVIAMNFMGETPEFIDRPNRKSHYIGKLNNMSAMFEGGNEKVIEALKSVMWDFKKYPDPEVTMINKI
jgi:hypothetical protein